MNKPLLKPKTDYVFKLLFGDERNADILTDFLKSVLDLPATEYERLEFDDTHLKREFEDDKLGILDVRVHTKSGNVINVEIQVLNTPEICQRVVYYASKLVSSQLSSGDEYTEIKPVVCIIITNFDMVSDSSAYHNKYLLSDMKSGSVFSDCIEINTLELTKLPQTSDGDSLYSWLKFIGAEREEEFEMASANNPVIQKAYGTLRELSEDEKARRVAESREKMARDERSRLRGARAEGEACGEARKALEMARSLKNLGVGLDVIAKSSGLSESEISRL